MIDVKVPFSKEDAEVFMEIAKELDKELVPFSGVSNGDMAFFDRLRKIGGRFVGHEDFVKMMESPSTPESFGLLVTPGQLFLSEDDYFVFFKKEDKTTPILAFTRAKLKILKELPKNVVDKVINIIAYFCGYKKSVSVHIKRVAETIVDVISVENPDKKRFIFTQRFTLNRLLSNFANQYKTYNYAKSQLSCCFAALIFLSLYTVDDAFDSPKGIILFNKEKEEEFNIVFQQYILLAR